jgi:hypothetical protein
VKRPGKGADPAAWAQARELLEQDDPIDALLELAARGKAARKGVAAAVEDAARVRALLAERADADPEAPAERLLRWASDASTEAQQRVNPIARNESFVCGRCGFAVPPAPGGKVRNHCPRCLHSRHVDGPVPGDRASDCGGLMKPTRPEQVGGAWRVTHVCVVCGHERRNRLFPDWAVEPDRLEVLWG